MKKLLLALTLVLGGLSLASPASAEDVAPTIVGSGEVGTTLTIASYGSAESQGGYTYAWFWDGDQDPGPNDTGESHVVTLADVGHELSVLVKPDDPGVERVESNRIPAIQGSLVAPTVTISGTATVKHTLTATYTSSGTPGAGVTGVWTLDGEDVKDETGLTYLLTEADAGHRVAFRTTSTQDGYADLVHSSSTLRIPAYNAKPPTTSGSMKVGRTLRRVSKGTWFGDGYSYSHYRWLRDGRSISGATHSSYTLTSRDRGHRVTLRVTATKSGFASVAAVSVKRSKVR